MQINPKAKLVSNLFSRNIKLIPTRDGYGEGLVILGEKNDKVIVLCADLSESTRCHWFAARFPERFIEVGVAEQNMAGLGAGMAMTGFIPFLSSFAVFSPGRNWEQIRISVCYNKANVKIIGSHAGISTGPDGATHQALEDIALMRVLPNMTVVVPADALEARKATIALGEMVGPAYLRLTRPATPVFTTEGSSFAIGQAELLVVGRDVTIIGCGPLLYQALLAAQVLAKKQGISAEVINSATIKPLDGRTIIKSAKKTGAVITVEEHQIYGGLGGAVAECLAGEQPVPMRFIGMPDSFGESGEAEDLLEKYGMSVEKIVRAVLEVVNQKK